MEKMLAKFYTYFPSHMIYLKHIKYLEHGIFIIWQTGGQIVCAIVCLTGI